METYIKQILDSAPEALHGKKPLEGHENRFLDKLSETTIENKNLIRELQNAQGLNKIPDQETIP